MGALPAVAPKARSTGHLRLYKPYLPTRVMKAPSGDHWLLLSRASPGASLVSGRDSRIAGLSAN